MIETTEKNMMETTQKNIAETNNNEDQINIAKTTNENIISETSNKEREETKIEYNSITNEVKYQCLNDNSLINKCIITNINNVELYNFLKNDILQRYSFSNDKSFVFEGEDGSIYQVTSSQNELFLLKSNNISDDYNLSIIDFSECEAILKKEYNINEDDSLIFIKKKIL